MSITDELRKVAAKTECANGRCEKLYRGDLEHIADRIDAEHEQQLVEARAEGVQEGFAADKGPREFVELPKDADGEYIHIGDEVEWRHSCGSCELRHGIVTGIKTDKIGDEVFYEVTINADRFAVRLMSNQLRHHHAPTVEDVLREMLYKAHIYDEREMELLPDLIADYAKRLTLAEEDA